MFHIHKLYAFFVFTGLVVAADALGSVDYTGQGTRHSGIPTQKRTSPIITDNGLYTKIVSQSLDDADKKKSACDRVQDQFLGTLPKPVVYLLTVLECGLRGYSGRFLFSGSPGLGKTHLAKLIAQETETELWVVKVGRIGDKYMGEGAKKMESIFTDARVQVAEGSPLLIFLDELDTITGQRKGDTHQEYKAILTTLTTEIADKDRNKNIFFMAATNMLGDMDDSVLSRFTDVCELTEPTYEDRIKFFERRFKAAGKPISRAEARNIAKSTTGYIFYGSVCPRELDEIAEKIMALHEAHCHKNKQNCDKPYSSYAQEASDMVLGATAIKKKAKTENPFTLANTRDVTSIAANVATIAIAVGKTTAGGSPA